MELHGVLRECFVHYPPLWDPVVRKTMEFHGVLYPLCVSVVNLTMELHGVTGSFSTEGFYR
jgi:hypothetical protein